MAELLRSHASGLRGSPTCVVSLNKYLAWRGDRFNLFAGEVESLEPFIAQHCLGTGFLPPLPMGKQRQSVTCTTGTVEKCDFDLFQPPVQAARVAEEWTTCDPLGCSRLRPYVPLCAEGLNKSAATLGGDPCAETPAFRRLPPYQSSSCAGDRARMRVRGRRRRALAVGHRDRDGGSGAPGWVSTLRHCAALRH